MQSIIFYLKLKNVKVWFQFPHLGMWKLNHIMQETMNTVQKKIAANSALCTFLSLNLQSHKFISQAFN